MIITSDRYSSLYVCTTQSYISDADPNDSFPKNLTVGDTELLAIVAGLERPKLDLEQVMMVQRYPTDVDGSYLAVGGASWSHVGPNEIAVLWPNAAKDTR